MRAQRRASPVLVALWVLLLAACARPVEVRSAPSGAASAEGVPIQVEHNVALATSLSVSLVDPAGTTHLLGSVAPGEMATFTFPSTQVSGNYYLVAETATGEQVVSRPFTLPQTGSVTWDLAVNTVTTG